jgi:hypothetical protein
MAGELMRTMMVARFGQTAEITLDELRIGQWHEPSVSM